MVQAANVLYVVACGGHTAGQLEGFIRRCQDDGWDVCVIASPSGLKFLDSADMARITGHAVRYDYKQPDEPDILPPPNAVAVVPATFNTINKWAHGVSDTLALGILHESIGRGLPIVAVPTLNAALGKHPVFLASVITLRSWGVSVVFDPDKYPLPEPGTGLGAADFFPWEVLESEVQHMLMRNATQGGAQSSLRWSRTGFGVNTQAQDGQE